MFVKALAAALSGLALSSMTVPPPPVATPAIQLVRCGFSTGTAWSFAPGRFVTAWHVASRGPCSIAGQPAPVVRHDTDMDIAELGGPDTGAHLTIRCRAYSRGRTYSGSGFARGQSPAHSAPYTGTGKRISILGLPNLAVLRGRAIPGMSGGPVTDSRGRVVGIVNVGSIQGAPIDPWMGSRELRDTFLCRENRP